MSAQIKVDVCVIGAGPVGLASSLRLADHGLTVVLVDSGFEHYDETAQKLSDAKIVDSQYHAQMQDAVRRVLGGTSHLWGGRCVPLDAVDFQTRPYVPLSGWPVSFEEVDRYHHDACVFLGAGPASFTVQSCQSLSTASQPLADKLRETDQELLTSELERWSGEPNAWRLHGGKIQQHPRIQVLSGQTCVGFDHREEGQAVTVAHLVNTRDAQTLTEVHAKVFIVACGGVESTRLILNSITSAEKQLHLAGAAHVGKYYMGHPSGKIADIKLKGDPRKTVFNFEKDGETYIRRRLTFRSQYLNQKELPNISFWLDNPPPADPAHGSGVLSAAYLALTMPVLWRWLAPAAIRDRMVGSLPIRRLPHLFNCARSPVSTAVFCVSFFYQRYIQRPRLPGFFTYSASNFYTLHYHAEQRPAAQSRITLLNERDAVGMRRVQVDLKWSDQDADDVVRAHRELDRILRKTQAGELIWRYPEESLRAQVLEQAIDGFHQIGTLRMGHSPAHAVTDSDGRFFGAPNLFAATSAIFPTSGQANPTLTAVALAMRQADVIQKVLSTH